jgi:hypothetical protein
MHGDKKGFIISSRFCRYVIESAHAGRSFVHVFSTVQELKHQYQEATDLERRPYELQPTSAFHGARAHSHDPQLTFSTA